MRLEDRRLAPGYAPESAGREPQQELTVLPDVSGLTAEAISAPPDLDPPAKQTRVSLPLGSNTREPVRVMSPVTALESPEDSG